MKINKLCHRSTTSWLKVVSHWHDCCIKKINLNCINVIRF